MPQYLYNGVGTILPGQYFNNGQATVVNAGEIGGTFAGVYLHSGGNLTNKSTGTITASQGSGFSSFGITTVSNYGTIDGFAYGIYLFDNGVITNHAEGLIVGHSSAGVWAGLDALTLDNAGTIEDTASTNGAGVILAAGVVTNENGGTITGYNGIIVSGLNATIFNAGSIGGSSVIVSAHDGVGIDLTGGGTVVNETGGRITGVNGVYAASAATIFNSGSIGNANAIWGIYLADGGVLTNQSGGVITGSQLAVGLKAGGTIINESGGALLKGVEVDGGAATIVNSGTINGGTGLGVFIAGGSAIVTNAGTISGSGKAVYFSGTAADTLIVDPGAVFTGAVKGNGTASSLVLASASSAGTLNGLGTQFTGFTGVTVAAGASWTIAAGTAGSVYIEAGAYARLSGNFLGTGTVENGATLANHGNLDANTGIGLPGALLASNGVVTNASGATISADSSYAIDSTGTGGRVVNAGTIDGVNGAVRLDGGSVTNQSGGYMLGNYGVYLSAAGIVSNAGTIHGTLHQGVRISGGGQIINLAGGQIYGTNDGLAVTQNAATISNAGSIGGGNVGAVLLGGGAFTNQGTGLVTGYGGIALAKSGTVMNTGSIVGATTAHGFGVDLESGGTVNNGTGGFIKGVVAVGATAASATVLNSGSIGGGADGVYLQTGGSVTNMSGGKISGVQGIHIAGGLGTVVNAGSISASPYGVDLSASGSFINNAGARLTVLSNIGDGVYLGGTNLDNYAYNAGTLIGGYNGIFAFHDPHSTVVNMGYLLGTVIGVGLDAGGMVTNGPNAEIYALSSNAGSTGVLTAGGAKGLTVDNEGLIKSNGRWGIVAYGPAVVTNTSSGTIESTGQYGIGIRFGQSGGTGTLINAGKVISNDGTAVSFKGAGGMVIVDPGAVFEGILAGDASALEFAPGSGSFAGLGSHYTGFTKITIDTGAQWTLTGTNTLTAGSTLTVDGRLTVQDAVLNDAGSVVNDGTIALDPSTVTLGPLTGTGVVDIGADGTLVTSATVSAGQTIDFNGADGSLALQPAEFSGEILGLAAGDVIELSGITDATDPHIVNGNTLQVDQTAGGSFQFLLDPATNYTDVPFVIGSAADGSDTVHIACFCKGTRIATSTGAVNVEELQPGDLVMTHAAGILPVRWVGRSDVSTRFADPLRVLPIRIRAGALGEDLPVRDLLLSPDHAILLEGILVQAAALVNGATILRERNVAERFSYYHVELATHQLLLAEGVPAESFVDNTDRMHFSNWDERTAPSQPIVELPYPRVKSYRQLPAALRCLAAVPKTA